MGLKDHRCDRCDKIPSVDPVTDEYDLYQMNHVYSGGRETLWFCGGCAGTVDGEYPRCPEEFVTDGVCSICGPTVEYFEKMFRDGMIVKANQ